MKKKILINAKHPEEKRVAIVQENTLVDFYIEVSTRESLKGNMYKGVIKRIEPALQGVFLEFGQKRHGFLQMRDVAPDSYKTKAKKGARPKVQEVLEKGQELIVQVEKEERDTKGAGLTTYVSIPGRYLVMMPGQEEKVGISRKISGKEERDRLREVFKGLKIPKKTGFILRTAGSEKSVEDLQNDLKYLTKLWAKIKAEGKKAKAPALIYKEHDIAVRTVRDYLTSDVGEVIVDDREAYNNVRGFLRKTMPWRSINVTHYKQKTPLFDKYELEDQIRRLGERYVHLPSRGYLVFDKTEALTSIDVNSGRGKKQKDMETMALKTNIEAAEEIARQLRLRDIGGLIVIDFIDMHSTKNRKAVEEKLREAMADDKAQFDTARISQFGMLEMTRERMRTAYFEHTGRKCPVCEGAGVVRTDEMAALAAFRDVHIKASRGGVKAATCRLPVNSANYLVNYMRDELSEVQKQFALKVDVIADPEILPGHFLNEFVKEEGAQAPALSPAKEAQTKKGSKKEEAKKEGAEEAENKPAKQRRKRRRKKTASSTKKKKATEGEAA